MTGVQKLLTKAGNSKQKCCREGRRPHTEPKAHPLGPDTQPGPTASPAGDVGLSAGSHLDVRVLRPRGYKLAIWVEIQAADVGFVSHERAKN